jgi:hypothetical protein
MERMNHGRNRSLNVFQPTPPLYYSRGDVSIQTGSGIVQQTDHEMVPAGCKHP